MENNLAKHIIAMADDSYLTGHPEWEFIVEEAKAILKKDIITIEWCLEDVIEQAKQDGKRITKKQAREVLQNLKDNHDCNYGITWETNSATIDLIIN